MKTRQERKIEAAEHWVGTHVHGLSRTNPDVTRAFRAGFDAGSADALEDVFQKRFLNALRDAGLVAPELNA